VRVRVRLFSCLPLLVLCSASAFAQNPPMKPGLWEHEIHLDASATPDVAAKFKAAGVVLPHQQVKTSVCIKTAQEWPKVLEILQKPVDPQCAISLRQTTTHGFKTTYSCHVGTTRMDYEITGTWPSADLFNTTTKTVSTYKGYTGQSVIVQSLAAHFVSSSCGAVKSGLAPAGR